MSPVAQSKGESTWSGSTAKQIQIQNAPAASLAAGHFRPQTTRDKTKAHPRQRKHKKDEPVE